MAEGKVFMGFMWSTSTIEYWCHRTYLFSCSHLRTSKLNHIKQYYLYSVPSTLFTLVQKQINAILFYSIMSSILPLLIKSSILWYLYLAFRLLIGLPILNFVFVTNPWHPVIVRYCKAENKSWTNFSFTDPVKGSIDQRTKHPIP